MSEADNKILGLMTDSKEEIAQKARGLHGLLLAATIGTEYGLSLNDDSMTILAKIAGEVDDYLSCLSSSDNDGQYKLNDIYEKLDAAGRTRLLKFAEELDGERLKAQ